VADAQKETKEHTRIGRVSRAFKKKGHKAMTPKVVETYWAYIERRRPDLLPAKNAADEFNEWSYTQRCAVQERQLSSALRTGSTLAFEKNWPAQSPVVFLSCCWMRAASASMATVVMSLTASLALALRPTLH